MGVYDIGDDPIIENLIRTGYPDGKEPIYPVCPNCGEESDYFYKMDNSIIGCDCCIERLFYDEVEI